MSSGHPTFRVLLVEDSPVSRTVIEKALGVRGHEVVSVETAEDALREHAAQPFPMMIVDWMLPGELDGLKLVEALRTSPSNDDLVIVAVTGRNTMADLDVLLEAGATDFLPKPFEAPVLDTRIAVAERTVQERKLRRKLQQKMASLIHHLPDGVIHTDHHCHILHVNNSFEAMTQYRESELLGLDMRLLVHGADDKELTTHPTRGFDGMHELRLRRRDGSLFHVELVRAPNGDEGVVCVVRDVTERNELRARLLMSDRLASMGTLAAGVAHEINNPLTFIMNNLSYLSGELASDPDSLNLLEVVNETQLGAERVNRIVRELRVFARGNDETAGPTDVHETLDRAIVMATNEIRHKALLVKSYEDVPPVRANSGKLGQVFLNLLVNAAHSLPLGRAQHNEIRVRTFQENGQVKVEVEDTGPGIPTELRERIFDPFFTTKPIGKGTGLGLAICHGIVNSAGGTIEVDSEEGVGSVFRVSLPVKVPA